MLLHSLPLFQNTTVEEVISFARLFHSLDGRLHQLFQDLPVHIVQPLDIQTACAGCELAKLIQQGGVRVKASHQVQRQVLLAREKPVNIQSPSRPLFPL